MKVDTPVDYRQEVEAAVRSGERARSLYAGGGGRHVRLLLEDPKGRHRLITKETGPRHEVPSIVDLAPAMSWDEREAHDLYGISFVGHEPMRALVDHEAKLETWTVPVHGADPYQIAVGPIHAGVIESGHFRFSVVGDRILHVDTRMFYKHRGLEQAAEGQPLRPAIAVVARACAACSVANAVAYADATEAILGLQATAELTRTRAILLELERVWNHLNDIAAVCAGVGLAAGTTHFLALTESSRRLNADLTGHRFLANAVEVGGSHIVGDGRRIRSDLALIGEKVEIGWHALVFNPSFQDRLEGVGAIDATTAKRLGMVGPAARASGIGHDARQYSPYPAYRGFEPVAPDRATGDVRARVEQRILELRQSFAILDRLLDAGPVEPSSAVEASVDPAPFAVGTVESPRGATSCVVEALDGTVGRVRLRTASYANWPAVARAAAGNLLPDFPVINKSFELCYSCSDR